MMCRISSIKPSESRHISSDRRPWPWFPMPVAIMVLFSCKCNNSDVNVCVIVFRIIPNIFISSIPIKIGVWRPCLCFSTSHRIVPVQALICQGRCIRNWEDSTDAFANRYWTTASSLIPFRLCNFMDRCKNCLTAYADASGLEHAVSNTTSPGQYKRSMFLRTLGNSTSYVPSTHMHIVFDIG